MLVLTFSTGIVGAIGFLGLNQVFVGNMTGNIVILGLGMAGAENMPVIGPAVALAGFVMGAALAGFALRGGARTGWTSRVTTLILVTAVIEICCASALFAQKPDGRDASAVAFAGVLGVAMGMQAASARHVAVKDVTTVVVTSTLTGFAADSALGKSTRRDTLRRIAAVLAMLLGAVIGGVSLKVGMGVGLMAAGTVTAAVAVIGHLAQRSRQVTG